MDHLRPYRDLLAWHADETRRWHEWFAANAAALATTFGDAPLATLRDVVAHIATVDLRYAHRLAGLPLADHRALAGAPFADVVAASQRAHALLATWLDDATPALVDAPIAIATLSSGEMTATPRAALTHALTHGTRHWAQVATVLRLAGWRADWRHDYIVKRRA